MQLRGDCTWTWQWISNPATSSPAFLRWVLNHSPACLFPQPLPSFLPPFLLTFVPSFLRRSSPVQRGASTHTRKSAPSHLYPLWDCPKVNSSHMLPLAGITWPLWRQTILWHAHCNPELLVTVSHRANFWLAHSQNACEALRTRYQAYQKSWLCANFSVESLIPRRWIDRSSDIRNRIQIWLNKNLG